MAVGLHLRLRLRKDLRLANSTAGQRILARTVLARWADRGLLSFRAKGPHLDLLVTCSRPTAGLETRMTEMTLVKRLGLPIGFQRALIEPARDQWHLTNLFRLILKGGDEEADPLHEASNLPDLLALRVLGARTATNVRQWLPRIKRQELVAYLGMPDLGEDVFSFDHLVTSTAAAAGLVDLTDRGVETVAALVALAAVAGSRLTTEQLGRLIGRSSRTARRLRTQRADGQLVRAIRLQMHLRRFKGDRHTVR